MEGYGRLRLFLDQFFGSGEVGKPKCERDGANYFP